MSSIMKLLLLVPLWILSAWGSLQLHSLDMNLGHSICGPWGCGPPTEALLGYHTFWLVLLTPVVLGVGFYFSSITNKRVGWGLTVLALFVMLGVAGYETYGFWSRSQSTEYLLQKFLFTVVTKVDLPMLQLIAGGIALVGFGYRKGSPGSEESDVRPEQLQNQGALGLAGK